MYIQIHEKTLTRISKICLALFLASNCQPAVSQSYTGKIVIDGVVYGENDSTTLKGSGVLGNDQRQVGHFESIKVTNSVNVNYQDNQDTQVEVTGDANLLPFIKTEVSNGVLTISSTHNYQAQQPLTVQIKSNVLKKLIHDGASDVNLIDLKEKSLSITLSGSGSIKAKGNVEQLSASISGSGEVMAKDLLCNQADIQISGSGNVNITAKDLLKAIISGAGEIIYYGNPKKVEPNITGSGSIEPGE